MKSRFVLLSILLLSTALVTTCGSTKTSSGSSLERSTTESQTVTTKSGNRQDWLPDEDYSTDELLESGILSKKDYAVLCDYRNLIYSDEAAVSLDSVLEGIYYDSPLYFPVKDIIDYGMKVDFTLQSSKDETVQDSFLIDELGLNDYRSQSLGPVSIFSSDFIGRKIGEEFLCVSDKGQTIRVTIDAAYQIMPYRQELITDEYVRKYVAADYEVSSREELLAYVKDNYLDKDTGATIDDYLNMIWEQSDYVISEDLVEREIAKELATYEAQAALEGMSFEDYWSQNVGDESTDDYLRPIVINDLKSELMMEQLIKELSVGLSIDEFEAFLDAYPEIEEYVNSGSISVSEAALLCAKEKVNRIIADMYNVSLQGL